MRVPAVVLVGGEGSRLRPLTDHVPKALVPLLGRPLLSYALDQLRVASVERAVLACGRLSTAIESAFGSSYEGLQLEYRVEPAPLGTAGAIRLAAAGMEGTFLALNGDSIRTAAIGELVEFHRAKRAKATMLLASVADPASFGLVRTEPSGRVREFVEKPEPDEIDTHHVNAGLYVLEPDVLALVPPARHVSIERVVFPTLAARGDLFALSLPGSLFDVGSPSGYLSAHAELISGRGIDIDPTAVVEKSAKLIPPTVVEADARIEERASLGPGVHVGRGARVGANASIRWTAVLPDAVVSADATLECAVVGPNVGVLQS